MVLQNNQMVLFCEQNSLSFDYLKKLKADLKKENFSLMSIKNDVFNKQFKVYNSKKLVNGSIFIIYKEVIDYNTNFKIVQKFIDYKFILCCLFENSFYSPLILKQFKKINNLDRLVFESGIIINTLLSAKFYNTVKQVSDGKAIIA